jgi:predicted ATPase/class 3 adenylate cyclase
MGDVPSGTVTFLFTDIEDSSRMWDQHPLQMRTSLEQHDELLATAIGANSGYIFTTAGDAFAAAFQTADAAAKAACDIQAAIEGAAWDKATPIRVRIGLHTGEAHERGGDFFGPAVIRTKRIEAAGHGGQILVSGVTARVLAGSTLVEWELSDLGEHALEGFREPERIHQLGGRNESFPELEAATSGRNNLPSRHLPLIGRDSDVGHVLQLCEQERLITLFGLGGIGKTSLALEVARALAAYNETSLWWCDLVSAASGDVVDTVAKSTGLATGALDATELATALGRRGPTWLVLDNCEHVVESVSELVAAVLAGSDVKILATSRVPIGGTGEVLVAVSPLDPDSAGVELFERAMVRVAATVPSNPDETATIRRICDRLAGIPLAIELVASRCRALSLDHIESRLDGLLSTSTPTASRGDERHQTMLAAIRWSIDLLDGDLRRGLGALAVFPGGFDLESAEAILVNEIGADPLTALESYVTSGLVEVNRQGGSARYRMLEPIRHYSEQHLWADPSRTRNRHLEHFLDRVEQAYGALGTHDCRPYLRLATDMPDLAECHRWALESERIDDDLRLYPVLVSSWIDIGQDAYDWATETASIEGVEDHFGWGAAWMCYLSGAVLNTAHPDRIVAALDRFATISADDPTYELALRGHANGNGVFTGRNWSLALSVYDQPAPHDTMARFNHFFFGGMGYAAAPESATGISPQDALERSIERFYEGLDWAAAVGATNFEAAFLQGIGNVLVRAGRLDEGVQSAQKAEELSDSLGMTTNRNLALYHQVVAALLGARIERDPYELLLRALESTIDAGHAPTAAYLAKPAARHLAQLGHHDTAALCMLQPDVGFPDILPELGTDLIPDQAWQWARSEAPNTSPLDVAKRALIELRDEQDSG